MGASFKFSHDVEYDPKTLPDANATVQAASELINEIQSSWSKGKTFHEQGQVVHTFNTRKGADFWMARVSSHSPTDSTPAVAETGITFEVFKEYILRNHTKNEVEYIPLLESFRTHSDEPDVIPDAFKDWEAFTVHYKFPRLFSDREMAVWILCIQPDPSVSQFFVVSLPSTHQVSEDVTRAVYCAVEAVTFNAAENRVDWVMAQTSDARGSIPRWIQDKSVTASVAADVPSFISWAAHKVGRPNQE